jgi:hypothetical protein
MWHSGRNSAASVMLAVTDSVDDALRYRRFARGKKDDDAFRIARSHQLGQDLRLSAARPVRAGQGARGDGFRRRELNARREAGVRQRLVSRSRHRGRSSRRVE